MHSIESLTPCRHHGWFIQCWQCYSYTIIVIMPAVRSLKKQRKNCPISVFILLRHARRWYIRSAIIELSRFLWHVNAALPRILQCTYLHYMPQASALCQWSPWSLGYERSVFVITRLLLQAGPFVTFVFQWIWHLCGCIFSVCNVCHSLQCYAVVPCKVARVVG